MYPCVSFAQQNHTSVTHNSESYQSNIIAFEHANERQPNCQENNIRHTLSCNAINTGLFYVLHIAHSLCSSLTHTARCMQRTICQLR